LEITKLGATGARPVKRPARSTAGASEPRSLDQATLSKGAAAEVKPTTPKRSGWASVKAQAWQVASKLALSLAGTAGAMAPETTLMHMLSTQFLTPALGAAARLGVMDALPAKADDLAASLKLNPDGVQRLLRACAAAGAVKAADDGTYTRTRMGEYLTSDHPRSLKPLAVMLTDEAHWESWGQLEHSVRTGNPAVQKSLGVDNVFEHYATHPQEAARFNDGMTAISRSVASSLGSYYDFTNARRIVDVGGGHGFLLSAALRSAPQARGTLYDLESVVSGAEPELEKHGVAGRVDRVGGSFFQSVPSGGDVYMMKTVLHDWTDAQCVQILTNVGKAMHDDARLLIIESLVTDKPSAADFMNLHMLVMAGGKERTRGEFEQLLEHSGLRLDRVIATDGPFHLLEARKA
jgi:hypothetical protein